MAKQGQVAPAAIGKLRRGHSKKGGFFELTGLASSERVGNRIRGMEDAHPFEGCQPP